MMKKILAILTVFLIFSCTPASTEEEFIPLSETDVRLEFTTEEPNYDEIQFTYYNNATAKDETQTLVFDYDNSGNSLPYIINWEDFGYKYIRGEAYRNNSSAAKLTLNLYVNNELVYEETETGSSSAYARVIFDYIIK